MKKIIFFLSLVLIPSLVMAEMIGLKVPTNQIGYEADIQYAGVRVKVLSVSGTEVIITSNTCVLYGIYASSATLDGAYVVFRDTDAVNGSGVQTISNFNVAASSASVSILVGTPVRFIKGLTGTLTKSAGGGPTSVTVLYTEQ